MNEHLKPVFEIILPRLEEAKIDYWVFGGVSIAAYAGDFIRKNKDVDIFVKEVDFQKAQSVLYSTLCNLYKQMNIKLIYYFPALKNNRPKLEIEIDKNEMFSMIPIYPKNNLVVFRYEDGDQEYSNQILERIERNISGYRFFTSRNEFIKDMFIKHIIVRPDKKDRPNIKKDGEAIFTPEEYKKYMPEKQKTIYR